MLTRQAALDQVKRFAAEVRQRGVPLRQAILFGSFARGEQHEWSDIDVALVADTFTGAGCVDISGFAVLLRHYVDFELHTFPTAYFEEGDPFTEEIKRTGIVVA